MLVYSKYPVYRSYNENGRRFANRSNTAKMPATNIVESDDGFRIDMAVPGLKKNDIDIDFENDELKIRAEVKKQTHENESVLRKEFDYNRFEKVFNIPDTVDRDSISATYKNGILEINILKREEFKVKPPREIAVN